MPNPRGSDLFSAVLHGLSDPLYPSFGNIRGIKASAHDYGVQFTMSHSWDFTWPLAL